MVRRPFLTAEWRHLLMLNYEVDPALLHPLVPAGTELDCWQGRALVSVVAFRFSTHACAACPFHCTATLTDLQIDSSPGVPSLPL